MSASRSRKQRAPRSLPCDPPQPAVIVPAVTRQAEASSSAQVHGRPRAHTFTIEDLIAEVRGGRLRIPIFQRPLKWQPHDVLKLLDSVYCGYPIGTLLLWLRPASADHLVFGSVTIEAPARADAWWVVDGQQRLLALTRALTGSGDALESFAAYFDLHTEKFIRPPRDPAPHQVPMTVVLDAERLM